MTQIEAIVRRNEVMDRLVEIWESAVREAYTFWSETDMLAVKQEVPQRIIETQQLYGFFDDDSMQGFIGVDGKKIEVLFVDATLRGQGIGRKLITFAITELGAIYVDVNEQNELGIRFYESIGFVRIARSDRDEHGKPYPILHLEFR